MRQRLYQAIISAMLFDARHVCLKNASETSQFSRVWNLVTLSLLCSSAVFCGINVVVVSYLTHKSRRAFLPFLLYCFFCLTSIIFVLPHAVYVTFFADDITETVFTVIIGGTYFTNVLYSAASFQLLYVYLERCLRMHYPFRLLNLPTACHQILAACFNLLIMAPSNSSVIYFVLKSYAKKTGTGLIQNNWQFSQEYPTFRVLTITSDVVATLVPAVAICVLARINTVKLGAVANFNQTAGCWNQRFGKIMSMEAWIHKEVRLCTALALLHVFIFVPNGIAGIVSNTTNIDLSVYPAFNVALIVIRAIQLVGISAHTAVFVAFCPAYRRVVVKTYRSLAEALQPNADIREDQANGKVRIEKF